MLLPHAGEAFPVTSAVQRASHVLADDHAAEEMSSLLQLRNTSGFLEAAQAVELAPSDRTGCDAVSQFSMISLPGSCRGY